MTEPHELALSDTAGMLASSAYAELLSEIKQKITDARTRAMLSVNKALLSLYWNIGSEILDRQQKAGWGAQVIGQLARDLKEEGHKGFSRSNLHSMRSFAAAWPQEKFVQQSVGQIPWGHNVALLERLTDPETRLWYARRAAAEGWSRSVLLHQISAQLHLRQGAAITNFHQALPAPDSELAQEMIRDPYDLGFIAGEKLIRERDLELALLADIEKFLLELGVGFAFVGRQKELIVNGSEFFLDLLFYHLHLRRYVVIELKIGRFEAEFAGKMNLYLNAVDAQLRHGDDKESIGIILCTERNHQVVEYALRGVQTPIGVSTYTLGDTEITKQLPAEFENQLPSVSLLTVGLQRIVDLSSVEESTGARQALDGQPG